MVGDTERDVLAGRAAGMRTCGVTYGVLGADGLTPHAPDSPRRSLRRCVAAHQRWAQLIGARSTTVMLPLAS